MPSPPLLVDVREPWEVAVCDLPDALLIPLMTLPGRLSELPRDRPVIVVCHHGQRSAMAAQYLRQTRIDARNLLGGVDAWAQQIDPTLARY